MTAARLNLLTCVVALCLFTNSSCWAEDTDPFASFPESCATQAREAHKIRMADPNRPETSGLSILDENSPPAMTASVASIKASSLLGGVGTLLWQGMLNTQTPRISKQASQQAARLYELFREDSDNSLFEAPIDFSTSGAYYRCITDTCANGAACLTIDVEKQASNYIAALPKIRKDFNKMLSWARSVKIFRSKVARLRRAYDRDENEVRQLFSGLPKKLAVLQVTIPND